MNCNLSTQFNTSSKSHNKTKIRLHKQPKQHNQHSWAFPRVENFAITSVVQKSGQTVDYTVQFRTMYLID